MPGLEYPCGAYAGRYGGHVCCICHSEDDEKQRLAGDATWMPRQDDVEKSRIIKIPKWVGAVGRNHPWVIKAAADEAAAQKAAADNPAADKAAADKAVSELSFSEKNNP